MLSISGGRFVTQEQSNKPIRCLIYGALLLLFFGCSDSYTPLQKPAVYIDPSLPDSVIPYFATVPVDYVFGPTKYEVIKELFLVEPDECDNEDCEEKQSDSLSVEKALLMKKRGVPQTIASKLLDLGVSLREIEWTSLEMTDNLKYRLKSEERKIGESPKMAWSLFSSGKKLGGQLKFKDDILGVQPLVGVRVTGGYSYYWREAHTDKDGKFKIPEKWNFDIDYEANFDSDDFLLEDGHSIYGEDLEIEKNDKHSDWNETFTGNKAKWCVVWTAAYQYWYGNNFGLKRPRSNSASNMSLDIEVYYKNDTDFKNAMEDAGFEYNSSIFGFYVLSASTTYDDRILIRAKNRMSNGIFRSSIHEIAHFSLNTNQKSSLFYAEEENYRDTYARGIEWYFTNNRYCAGDLKASCEVSYIRHYIGLVQDLIDANDDCANGDEVVSDKVSGFKIVDLEKAFYASKNLNELKSYIIKNLKSGENGRSYTEKNLNILFDYWKEWL